MKKIFLIFTTFILFVFINKSYASGNYVYVSGDSIGIKLNTNIEVLGTYGINGTDDIYTPWKNKIYEHDIILKVNDNDVTSSLMLEEYIKQSNGNDLNLTIKRNDNIIDVNITPIKQNNSYSLGLIVKDYQMGIGTLSFINDNMKFASLAHNMIKEDIISGEIYYANVTDIVKPKGQTPGSKKGEILQTKIGNVSSNMFIGVYGDYLSSSNLKNLEKYEVSTIKDVHKGRASLLTCIDGNKVEKFNVEIKECLNQTKCDEKGLKINVIDDKLKDKAGGIIQGMSGSPIIQDNRLVGCLSHVSLKNPYEGYACYAKFMYDVIN